MLINFEIERARRILREEFNEDPETWEAAHYALGAAVQRLHDACATPDVATIASTYRVVGELLDELAKASRPH